MQVHKAIAPSYEQLRPLKESTTATFPVYRDLVDTLVTAKTYPDDTVAHLLAACAGYAYSSADTVSMIMARMGLDENHCLMIGQYVDAMFISSTSFLVQSRDGRVAVLGYRGTEPLNFITWLTDLDVYPDKVAFPFRGATGPFEVHAGFYRNVRATRYEVVAALERALEGRSVLDDGRPGAHPLPDKGRMEYPLEALYLTGHSLGGAMAAILAVMLVTEPENEERARLAEKLRAVYTFGQPMIGSRELAKACDADEFLREKVIRYVYRRDVVPHLPPTDSGDFAHFGQEYRYEGTWPWILQEQPTEQLARLTGLVEAPIAFLARQVRLFRNVPFHYSLNDHGPQHYVSALTPPGVPSEFGDYLVACRSVELGS